MSLPKILVIVGPTASGKTALSVELARRFNGEIVSADSMQIYKDMDIATAKPTAREMCGIPHYLISIIGKDETFSVADFVSRAETAVTDILSRNKLPIIAGGTGLYVDTFVNNLTLAEECGDEEYRESLKKTAEQNGKLHLLEMLSEIDPETAEKLHPNNLGRIIRALEIYKTTGIPMSEHIRRSKEAGRKYEPLFIGVSTAERENLYKRIDMRVDQMIDNGLIDEAKRFYADGSSLTAASAIGYKELKPYIDRQMPLCDAVENLKRETRRYAKRQLTWFRRNQEINWFFSDTYPSFENMADEIAQTVDTFLKSEGK